MQVWSPDQLRAFLNHVQADRLYAAWLLAVTTGMRRGEILGLRWSDLDLEAGRVAVRRPRVVVDYRAGLGAEDARRRAEGKSMRDIRRCLKRAVARQLFKLLERYGSAAVEVAAVH